MTFLRGFSFADWRFLSDDVIVGHCLFTHCGPMFGVENALIVFTVGRFGAEAAAFP